MEIVFAKKRIKIATVALNFMYNSLKKNTNSQHLTGKMLLFINRLYKFDIKDTEG